MDQCLQLPVAVHIFMLHAYTSLFLVTITRSHQDPYCPLSQQHDVAVCLYSSYYMSCMTGRGVVQNKVHVPRVQYEMTNRQKPLHLNALLSTAQLCQQLRCCMLLHQAMCVIASLTAGQSQEEQESFISLTRVPCHVLSLFERIGNQSLSVKLLRRTLSDSMRVQG